MFQDYLEDTTDIDTLASLEINLILSNNNINISVRLIADRVSKSINIIQRYIIQRYIISIYNIHMTYIQKHYIQLHYIQIRIFKHRPSTGIRTFVSRCLCITPKTGETRAPKYMAFFSL